MNPVATGMNLVATNPEDTDTNRLDPDTATRHTLVAIRLTRVDTHRQDTLDPTDIPHRISNVNMQRKRYTYPNPNGLTIKSVSQFTKLNAKWNTKWGN